MTSSLLEAQLFTEGPIQFPFDCDIQWVDGEQGFHYPAHWHHHMELIYVFEGHVAVTVGGQLYSMSEGELLLINAHEVHAVDVGKGPTTEYLVLRCVPEMLYNTSSTVFESKYILPFLVDSLSFRRHFARDGLRQASVPVMMKQIYQEYASRPYGYELAIRSEMLKLFLWILRAWESMGYPISNRRLLHNNNAEPFGTMFDYMRQHYNEPISPEMAAQMCNMSYSHFTRLFKAITGQTFTKYMNYLRVTEAEKLMLTTNLNMTEIAQRTGFSHSSYFIKQFKLSRKMTPKQFLKLRNRKP